MREKILNKIHEVQHDSQKKCLYESLDKIRIRDSREVRQKWNIILLSKTANAEEIEVFERDSATIFEMFEIAGLRCICHYKPLKYILYFNLHSNSRQ